MNCPALQVGAHVKTAHSCTSAPSVAETVCFFQCPKGYTLSGPSGKTCQLDGTWTDHAVPVECDGKFSGLKKTTAAKRVAVLNWN